MADNNINKLFGINVIKGENAPSESKLSLRVYIVGAIRSLLFQTGIKPGPNPEWNTNVKFFNPVRGLRLHFELLSRDNVVAIGDFDPRIQPVRQNQATTAVTMFLLRKTQPHQNQLSNIYIRVHYMPMILKEFLPQNLLINLNPSFSNPFYITVDPATPIPIKVASENYRCQYELSAVLLNEKHNQYEVVNSSFKFSSKGANHSGLNLSGTLYSLSQSLRLDPKMLSSSLVKYVLIILSSINYIPLKNAFKTSENSPIDAVVTTWSTNEVSGQYQSTKIYNLTSLPAQSMKIAGQFPLICRSDTSTAVVAVGRIQGDQLIFEANDTLIPNEKIPLSPLDPTEIVPLICKTSQFSRDAPLQQADYCHYVQYPLLIPRSLNESLNLCADPVIFARASSCMNHIFSSTALNSRFEQLFVCNKLTPHQGQGSISFTGQGITANLPYVPDDVFFLLFSIYGETTLEHDLNKLVDKKNADNNLVCYVNKEKMILNAPYNYSRTKNSLMWFALYREPFGGWGILNVRRGECSTDPKNLRLIFVDLLKQCLKF